MFVIATSSKAEQPPKRTDQRNKLTPASKFDTAELARSVLAIIASAISNSEANIEHVVTSQLDNQLSSLDFILLVRDRQHLAQIMRNLKILDMVKTITRL